MVEVEQGYLRGSSDGRTSVFRSIPYAAPPVGVARFGAPSPHPPWTGVRDATRPGPTAPQPARGVFGPLDLTPYFAPGWVPGEDYLTVNVWAPRGGIPSPVLVFLHGGGSLAGSSYSPLLDGRRFAVNGVLVVTVNYRLGIAGFLDLPGAPANRGLLDVFAALRWVQRNIAAFGGDPDRVTLGGQSAGATLTAAAVAEAERAWLFHRAIMQSGSGDGAFTSEQAAIVTVAAADTLGVTADLAGFRELPDEQLVAATASLMGLHLSTAAARDPLQRITPFSVVLPVQPTDALGSAAGSVDLLIGHNSEEGNLYLVPQGRLAGTTAAELQDAAAYANPDPAAALAMYTVAHPTATAGQFRSMLLGDAAFGSGTRRFADAHARSSGPTYCYEFGWRSTALGGQLGAAHVVETPFVFDNLLPALRGENKLLGPAAPPQQMADRMHRAWVGFVTDGSPGWPEYRVPTRTTMRIVDRWTPIDDPHRAVRAAWA